MAIGRGEVERPQHREEIGPVPELDDTVFVRKITVAEHNAWSHPRLEAALAEEEGRKFEAFGKIMEARLTLVFHACVDASGEQLFDDIEQVRAWPADAVYFIAEKVERMNGLTKEGADEIAGN